MKIRLLAWGLGLVLGRAFASSSPALQSVERLGPFDLAASVLSNLESEYASGGLSLKDLDRGYAIAQSRLKVKAALEDLSLRRKEVEALVRLEKLSEPSRLATEVEGLAREAKATRAWCGLGMGAARRLAADPTPKGAMRRDWLFIGGVAKAYCAGSGEEWIREALDLGAAGRRKEALETALRYAESLSGPAHDRD